MDIIMAWPEEKKQPPYSSIAEREKKYSSFLNPPLGVLAFFDHIPTTTTTQLTDLLIYTPHTHTHTQTPDSIRIYQKKNRTEPKCETKKKSTNYTHNTHWWTSTKPNQKKEHEHFFSMKKNGSQQQQQQKMEKNLHPSGGIGQIDQHYCSCWPGCCCFFWCWHWGEYVQYL